MANLVIEMKAKWGSQTIKRTGQLDVLSNSKAYSEQLNTFINV